MSIHLQFDQTKKLNTLNLMLKIVEVIRSESPDKVLLLFDINFKERRSPRNEVA